MIDAHHNVSEAVELAVASASMIDASFLEACPGLPNDMRNELAAAVTATAFRRYRSGLPVDAFHVTEELVQGGSSVVGPDTVERVIALTHYPLTVDPSSLAKEIQQKAQRRRLITQTDLLRSAAHDPSISDSSITRMLADITTTFQKGSGNDRFKFLTMRELADADLRMDFIIKGVLAAGLTGGVFGPSKGMKTSLILAAAYSIASGVPFLGTFEIPRPRKVLIMSGESGLATIRSTLARISDWGQIDYRDLPIVVSDEVPTLTDASDITALEREIVRTDSQVAFLDPFYHMAGDAAADMANQLAMGRVLKEMPALGRRTGATIQYAHHLRKVVAIGEPSTLADIQGSGHDAHVRQWWCLNRRSEFDPNAGKADLWLSVGSSLGFSRLLAVDINEGVMRDDGTGRYWSVTVNEPTAARQAAKTEQTKKRETEKWQQAQATRRVRISKLIEAYKSRPDGDTKSALKGLAGVSAAVFEDVNADLLRCGAVVTTVRMKHTRSETFYSLAEDWDRKVSQLTTYASAGTNQPA